MKGVNPNEWNTLINDPNNSGIIERQETSDRNPENAIPGNNPLQICKAPYKAVNFGINEVSVSTQKDIAPRTRILEPLGSINIYEQSIKEGLAMIDDGHRDGKRRHWFLCVICLFLCGIRSLWLSPGQMCNFVFNYL